MEVEARYTTALNCVITQDGRTTFVVSVLKGYLIIALILHKQRTIIILKRTYIIIYI